MNIYASMCSRKENQWEESVLGWIDIILHAHRVLGRANSSFTSSWHHLVTIIVHSGHFWQKKEMIEGEKNYRKIDAKR